METFNELDELEEIKSFLLQTQLHLVAPSGLGAPAAATASVHPLTAQRGGASMPIDSAGEHFGARRTVDVILLCAALILPVALLFVIRAWRRAQDAALAATKREGDAGRDEGRVRRLGSAYNVAVPREAAGLTGIDRKPQEADEGAVLQDAFRPRGAPPRPPARGGRGGRAMQAKQLWQPLATSASGGRSVAFKSAVLLSSVFAIYASVALVFEPLYGERLWAGAGNATREAAPELPKMPNPLFRESGEFRTRRWPQLLFLTRQEAEFARRMVFALLLGALLGLERRESNRGAGVRTMSLVSLGACVFTLGGTYAFERGTQEWDASRVSAALPSGVGFLGGALIFKDNGQIQGLTTACGVWLACAVGMCCGGGMYFVSAFGVCCMVTILRFGPRHVTAALEDLEPEPAAAPTTQPLAEPLFERLPSPTASRRKLSVTGLQLSADE